MIVCSSLEVEATSVRFEGDAWFEAEAVSVPPQFRIFLINGTKVGWGGVLTYNSPVE